LADVLEQLQPMTTRRLEDKVTEHFLKIADRRFKGGKIILPHGATPEFEWPDGTRRALETISGFEKRSFGIAFSLALAGITKRRVPLVIDTPLGNADSEYRPRTLEALADFDSDQVIILTHDEEVTPRLMRSISKSINQTFLITFNNRQEGSAVQRDKYFEE
jgi:DNA sulfur modification protein DndD